MKFNNGDIFLALNGTESPLSKLAKEKFPVKVSYDLAKMMDKLERQFKVIENVRQGLIKKYGTPDGKGSVSIKTDAEEYAPFMNELAELMNDEIELDIQKVKVPSKVNDKDIIIEPQYMMILSKFIEVE